MIEQRKRNAPTTLSWWWALLLTASLLSSCAPQKEPIEFGKDTCVFCQMGIADKRFGAELVTNKGRVYKFDSLECMISYSPQANLAPKDIHSQWVIDFSQPGKLVNIDKCQFLLSSNLPSPMGLNVSSFANQHELEKNQKSSGGKVILWPEVRQLTQQWLQARKNAVRNGESSSPSQKSEKPCCSTGEKKCCSSSGKKDCCSKNKPEKDKVKG